MPTLNCTSSPPIPISMADQTASPPHQREFALGTAAFGAPAADGHRSDYEENADAWLALLVQHHAPAEVSRGLCLMGRTGRDAVFRHAPQARLHLDSNLRQSAEAWDRQLAAVRQSLVTRGKLPTALKITWDGLQLGQVAVDFPALVTAALQGVGSSITSLELEHYRWRIWPNGRRSRCSTSILPVVDATAFLHALATACPNLQRLTVRGFNITLPPPELLPKLTHLDVAPQTTNSIIGRQQTEHVSVSIAPFVSQLTSLSLSGINPADMSLILTPDQPPNTTLTHCATDLTVDSALLDRLVRYAPTLTSLCASGLDIHTEAYKGLQWGVTQFECRGGLTAYSLARLPSSAGGRLSVTGSTFVKYKVESEQGLYPGVSARLPQWSFTSARIAPHTHLAAEHRPTGLRAALHDLACHPTAPSHTLTLRGLDWSRDLADAVCDVLPSLAHLHISVDTGNEPLTDMQLGALLRLGPAVRSLSVPKLALESEQHSGAVWPWEEVRVREVDLEDLCKLPDPGCGEGSTRRVVASHLLITHTVPEVGAERIAQRLGSLQWRDTPMTFKLPMLPVHTDTNTNTDSDQSDTDTEEHTEPDRTHVYEALTAQLALLRAVQLHRSVDRRFTCVRLEGWVMDHPAIEALQGLPADWACGLEFDHTCRWPLEPAAYAELAKRVPTAYTSWHVHTHGLSKGLGQGLCESLEQQRAELPGLGYVRLHVAGYDSRHNRKCYKHVLLV